MDGLVVDVGQKVEGLVPYNQLFEFEVNAEDAAQYFKPGDELQASSDEGPTSGRR